MNSLANEKLQGLYINLARAKCRRTEIIKKITT